MRYHPILEAILAVAQYEPQRIYERLAFERVMKDPQVFRDNVKRSMQKKTGPYR